MCVCVWMYIVGHCLIVIIIGNGYSSTPGQNCLHFTLH